MSQTAVQKWEDRYAQIDPRQPVHPAWVIKHHLRRLPLRGRALDVASGLGGNARFLAQCGLTVDAWDFSDNALTHLNNWAAVNRLPITPTICDLDQVLMPYQQYDVITVSRYLNRSLFKQLPMALKPGGWLVIQTFLAPVQDKAPSNPAFYLQSGELNRLASQDSNWRQMSIEIFGEGWLTEGETRQRYSWLLAKKEA